MKGKGDAASMQPIEMKASSGAGGRKKWTLEEVTILRDCIEEQMEQDAGQNINWSLVSARLPGRNAKQCRFRWLNQNTDKTRLGNWEHVEELVLASVHSKQGPTWAHISRLLKSRTENSVKNRWNSAFRSQTLYQPYSILWHYTKHLRQGEPPAAALTAACEDWKELVPEQLARDVLEEVDAWLVFHDDPSMEVTLDGPSTKHGLKPNSPMGFALSHTRRATGHTPDTKRLASSPRPAARTPKISHDNHNSQSSQADDDLAHVQGKLQPLMISPAMPTTQHISPSVCYMAPNLAGAAGCSAQSSPTHVDPNMALASALQLAHPESLYQPSHLVACNGHVFTMVPNLSPMAVAQSGQLMPNVTQPAAPLVMLMPAGIQWPAGLMAAGMQAAMGWQAGQPSMLGAAPGFVGW